MIEIINCYKAHFPDLRLIGKKYTDEDRINGNFGAKWGEWFEQGYFEPLEKLGDLVENEGAYLGAMTINAGIFEYWIGMFFPAGTTAPEGYEYVDIKEGDVGICWIHGREDNGEIYGENAHTMCADKMAEAGMTFEEDFENGEIPWFFERYNCPRFTTPDEEGKVILDYGIYLKS